MSGALFPAWRPGADGRDVLARLSDRLQAARPSDAPSLQLRRPDQWHVTLCFIGEYPSPRLTPVLSDAFAKAAGRIPPHGWTIGRLAYWPHSGAVVALPAPCPALQALCDATRDAIRRAGMGPAAATTQAHVTLAFVERGLPPQTWLDAVDCPGDTLQVEQFELLFNPGGRYEALGTWPLSGNALPAPPRQDTLFP